MTKRAEAPQPPGGSFWPHPCFLGLAPGDSDYRRSKVAILPIPYEATTSYGAGARFGPGAIIDASKELEFYDPVTGSEAATELGFHTLPPVFPDFSGPGNMIAAISKCAAPLYRSGKFVLALGGEHSVTVGLVRAARRKWRDLCVVQLDAHADLRDEYEGTRFSHACSARRALDELKPSKKLQLVQVGVRNISREGHAFLKAQGQRVRTFPADYIIADSTGLWVEELGELVAGRDVYLTVDLDALDPSIMPAVGTPEPGGLLWHHVTALVEKVAGAARIVAADLVELAPQPGNHAPDFLAAKLGYLVARRALGK